MHNAQNFDPVLHNARDNWSRNTLFLSIFYKIDGLNVLLDWNFVSFLFAWLECHEKVDFSTWEVYFLIRWQENASTYRGFLLTEVLLREVFLRTKHYKFAGADKFLLLREVFYLQRFLLILIVTLKSPSTLLASLEFISIFSANFFQGVPPRVAIYIS